MWLPDAVLDIICRQGFFVLFFFFKGLSSRFWELLLDLPIFLLIHKIPLDTFLYNSLFRGCWRFYLLQYAWQPSEQLWMTPEYQLNSKLSKTNLERCMPLSPVCEIGTCNIHLYSPSWSFQFYTFNWKKSNSLMRWDTHMHVDNAHLRYIRVKSQSKTKICQPFLGL